MTQEDIDEIKKELEEQKQRNEEMAKLLRDLDKRLKEQKFLDEREFIVERARDSKKGTVERRLEKDLRDIETKKVKKSRHIHKKPRPDPRIVLPPEIEFFKSDEFKKKIEKINKKAEKLSKEGIKITTKITDKISKGIQKYLEKETERIRKAVNISKEELEEIRFEISQVRKEINEYQRELDKARSNLHKAKVEVRGAQRRLERSSVRGDKKKIQIAREELNAASDYLNDSEEHIREVRSELIQAKREFARLQRRAEKIHKVQSKDKSPHVIRINDAEMELDGTMSEYITRVMDSVGKNLETTFNTVFKDGKKIYKKATSKDGKRVNKRVSKINNSTRDGINGHFFEGSSTLLSALGDENRLKILKILEASPQYQKELAEETGLKGGSFKHHTDILQEADYITREAVRGRYLITQLGIEALKLAEMIYVRKKRLREEDSINIDIED